LRIDDFRLQPAENGVFSLVYDIGGDTDPGVFVRNLRSGDISTVMSYVYRFGEMEENIPVDALTVIPAAAFGICIVVAYGNDIVARSENISDYKILKNNTKSLIPIEMMIKYLMVEGL